MGIRNWISQVRKQGDAAALSRAEAEATAGSVEERELVSGDLGALGADQSAAARLMGDASSGSGERLSD